MILTNEKLEEEVEEYFTLKQMIDEAQARLEQLKPDIVKAVSGSEKIGQYTVSVSILQQDRLDSTKLKNEQPEIYKQYTKQIEYTVLRVKKI